VCLVALAAVCLGAATLMAVQAAPTLGFDSAADFLKLPEHLYLGEAAGVATNSRGHVFVYTRTGTSTVTIGTSRAFSRGGARLFEFDGSGTFVREIGQGLYGMNVAQAVRVDPQDNIWIVDAGSNQVIKFAPDGHVLLVLGRKPEALNVPAAPGASERGTGAGVPGDNFNQPTDVAWDAAGDIFVADGYGNARVAKFDHAGKFLASVGGRGADPGQFNLPSALAVDARGNVYVADRGNKRIQVLDSSLRPTKQITGIGSPRALCITSGSHQYLFSSNSNNSDTMDNGEIYKLELDGTLLGQFGRAGKLLKEFGTVNQMDCRSDRELYVGELANWRVQKLTLR
jgi:sugar lactone lactonase YvrE